MSLHGIFFSISFLLLIFFLFTKFKPLFGLSGGFLFLAFSCYFGLPSIYKFSGFVVSFVIFEVISIPIFRLIRNRDEDVKLRNYIGKIGEIRDVVNLRRGIFLLHCCGKDFTAVGDIKLGDRVEIVGVKEKNVVAKRV